MKPLLAFVDHSFHQKTHSGDFLRKIFAQHFTIVDFWDDSWRGGQTVTAAEVNQSGCRAVFFFQSLMPLAELRTLKGHIMWAPMYDGVRTYGKSFWLELLTIPMTILSFCRTLHAQLQGYGLNTHYFQYWIDPGSLPPQPNYESNRVFFWQRSDITWQHVKQLLSQQTIDRCILKIDPDHDGFKAVYPSDQDIADYHIELVHGTITAEQYRQLLQRSNIFIAPRYYEGIGMASLEAMGMGMLVIGPDHPTLNEYIQSGTNGWLYSDATQPLPSLNLAQLGEQAHQDALMGWQQWQAQTDVVLQLMIEPAKPARPLRYSERVYLAYCRLTGRI
ncbi:MAG: glycosyltransferase [Candidatus Kerfeldbacteria bacterium]|nr:glycosyltransferase [Candidatus Kerfeldbacteria bacterium]